MPSFVFPDFTHDTIDGGRLRLVEVLGEGAYGVVYLAVEERTPRTSTDPLKYAVKIMPKADPQAALWTFQRREMMTQHSVSCHPNIVTLHDVFEDDQYFYFILDYCPGGDLFHAMVEQRRYAGNDALVKKVFLQLLDAVQFCHDHGVFHRDLKPDNILTNEDGTQVYIGDFGLATTSEHSSSFGCGSAYYLSPECIGEEYGYQPYSTRANDVWSLGVILTNLIAGRNPWGLANTRDRSFLQHVASPATYLREMLPISAEAGAILQSVFATDPAARIGIPALRERIVKARTFFLSEAEIARSSRWVQLVAAGYRPRDDAAPGPVEAPDTPRAQDGPVGPTEEEAYMIAYADRERDYPAQPAGLTAGSVGSSQRAPSVGLVTPASHADDPAVATRDIPKMPSELFVGAAPAVAVRKSFPAREVVEWVDVVV